mmetsp:Transcript_39356/g.116673  ORF Transcript_39356/g.116673 Transcript_39356/m.116673 type:complete len:222 (-) Transcript_39356:531-1196(-)
MREAQVGPLDVLGLAPGRGRELARPAVLHHLQQGHHGEEGAERDEAARPRALRLLRVPRLEFLLRVHLGDHGRDVLVELPEPLPELRDGVDLLAAAPEHPDLVLGAAAGGREDLARVLEPHDQGVPLRHPPLQVAEVQHRLRLHDLARKHPRKVLGDGPAGAELGGEVAQHHGVVLGRGPAEVLVALGGVPAELGVHEVHRVDEEDVGGGDRGPDPGVAVR